MLEEFKPVVRNPMFARLWTSQILSQITINIMNFLFLIRLFAATGSTIAISFLWIAYSLPAILAGPIGAASVDLVSKRKLLVFANLLQALTIFSFALLHPNKIFLLYGVGFIYSLFNQFYVPAEAASVPSLVSKRDLASANSLFFLTQQASLVIGWSLAGVLSKTLGFSLSLYVCSFLLFLAFLSVLLLPEMAPTNTVSKNLEKAIGQFFASITEGYNFIKGKEKVLYPFLFLGGLQVAASIVVVNFPAFATEILKIGISSSGIYIVIPAGIGAIFGAVMSTKLLKDGWRKRRLIELSLMLVTFSVFLLTFLAPELGRILRLTLGMVLVATAAYAFVGLIIPTQTYLQEVTPEDLRGRVFGNFWFLVNIASVLPVVFAGTLTEILGIKMLLTLLFGAGLLILIYLRTDRERFMQNGN